MSRRAPTYMALSRYILPRHSKISTTYHFSNSPPPFRIVTPQNIHCKSHFITPSACPLQLTVTGHIHSMFISQSPFSMLIVFTCHMSFTLRSHALNDLMSIYDWPHTHCSFDLFFFSQWIPVHSTSTPFRSFPIPFTLPVY
jgi:hypothetical protein